VRLLLKINSKLAPRIFFKKLRALGQPPRGLRISLIGRFQEFFEINPLKFFSARMERRLLTPQDLRNKLPSLKPALFELCCDQSPIWSARSFCSIKCAGLSFSFLGAFPASIPSGGVAPRPISKYDPPDGARWLPAY